MNSGLGKRNAEFKGNWDISMVYCKLIVKFGKDANEFKRSMEKQ